MTDNHPITPPPELVEEWANASARTHRENGTYAQHEFALATRRPAGEPIGSWMRAVRGPLSSTTTITVTKMNSAPSDAPSRRA